MAGGVKLKLFERDVVMASPANYAVVADVIRELGYHVFILERTNHLDSVIGRLSRKRTGVLHCKEAKGCDPSELNISAALQCNPTVHLIDKFRLYHRAADLMQRMLQRPGTVPSAVQSASRDRQVRDTTGGTQPIPKASTSQGHVLRLEYEQLVDRPQVWAHVLRILGFPEVESCLLREDSQKRVVQTQRELIRNYEPFAECLRRHGQQYSKLLQPDRRPASGLLPQHVQGMCAHVRARDGAANENFLPH